MGGNGAALEVINGASLADATGVVVAALAGASTGVLAAAAEVDSAEPCSVSGEPDGGPAGGSLANMEPNRPL